jgi:hypothetical protein
MVYDVGNLNNPFGFAVTAQWFMLQYLPTYCAPFLRLVTCMIKAAALMVSLWLGSSFVNGWHVANIIH